jgi:hypothetical protein
MILIDSSVWIDYFTGKHTHETELISNIIGTDIIVIGDLIWVEVLQGFQKESDFKRFRSYLVFFFSKK